MEKYVTNSVSTPYQLRINSDSPSTPAPPPDTPLKVPVKMLKTLKIRLIYAYLTLTKPRVNKGMIKRGVRGE